MAEGCRVILVGMMGSGKTSVGRLLSERTGWPHHDNDELLRRLSGANPREILARDGVEALRAAESAALADGLGQPEPAIVGAAAGTILDAASRRLLQRTGLVVWLRVTGSTIARRAAGADHRPWLDAGGAAWIESALRERDPLYAAVADLVVDADAAAPPAIADEVMDGLVGFSPCEPWLPPA